MSLFAPIGHARFYDPGIGDPYKSKSASFKYNIVQPSHLKRKSNKIVYRVSQQKMFEFARRARSLPLPPDREITFGRGEKIRTEYSLFMNPTKHVRIFKREKIVLTKVKKYPKDPNLAAALRGEQRIRALFDIHDGMFRMAQATLWRLANDKRTPVLQKQRDAIFSGLAAIEMDWDNVALMSLKYSIKEGLGHPKGKKDKPVSDDAKKEDSYYTNEMLKVASRLKDEDAIDQIVNSVPANLVGNMQSHKLMDNIFFTLAKLKFHKNEGALDALENKLTENSPVMEKAQLLRALGYIESKKHKAALRLLKKLSASEDRDINEKARVNLARLLAIFSQYDQALRVYKTLPIESLERLDTILEIAWLEFENGEYRYSLGKSIGLQSKFFYHAFLPEIYILEAYSRKSMCDFGGAEETLMRFKQDYTREISQMRDLVRQKKRNKKFSMYGELKRAFRNQDTERIRRYERYLLQVPTINNLQSQLHSMQSEVEMLDNEVLARPIHSNAQYMSNRKFVIKSLDKFYKRTRKNSLRIIEETVYEELKYMDRKLLALFQQVEFLNLDISASADINYGLQSALNYPELPKEEEEYLPASKNVWPFEDDEFWEDEIAWLRVANPSKCIPKSKDDPENNLAATDY